MIEPIFVEGNAPTWKNLIVDPTEVQSNRDKALLWRATNLAIESAFRFGKDLPVGAVAASGNWIVGRYFASDNRTKYRQSHAELMAIMDWQMTNITGGAPEPDTIVVSLEPCDICQDFLATIPSLKRVGFGLSRSSAEKQGLVKPHDETIFQRALRLHLPFEVFQVKDDALLEVGGAVLECTSRNPQTESVEVDQQRLHNVLVAINER